MRAALRTSITALLAGLTWIISSDLWLSYSRDTQVDFVALGKGSFFVFMMSVLIYWLVRQSHTKLERSATAFRKMYHDNPEPIIVVRESDQQILASNPAAQNFYGYTSSEFKTLNINNLQKQEIQKKDLHVHVKKNGKEAIVRQLATPFSFKGEDAKYIVVQDVTQTEELNNALLQRERAYDTVVKSEFTYLMRLNLEGKYEYVNNAYQQAFGHISDDFIGQHFTNTVIPEDIPLCAKAAEEALENPGRIISLAVRKFAKEGAPIATTWELIATVDALGNMKGLQGVGREMMEFDELRATHIKTKSQLDVILNTIKDGFFIVDNDLKVVLANRAFLILLNREGENIIGESITDVIPNWKNTVSSIVLPKAIKEQVGTVFEAYNPYFDIWFVISAFPYEGGLAVFYHDITESKETELKLKRSEANLLGLINNTRDLVWSFDNNLNILTFNQAFHNACLDHLGIDFHEGDHAFPENIESSRLSTFNKLYSRALRGEYVTEVLDLSDEKGKPIIFEAVISPIRDNENNILGAACFARDISEKEKQRLILEKSIERQKIVAEVTKDAIWEYIPSEQKFIWSSGILATFGYNELETNVKWWIDKVHPEDLEPTIESFQAAINSTHRDWNASYRFKHQNGEYRWISEVAIILRNDNGEATRVIGSMKDEHILRENRKEIEMLSEAMMKSSTGVVITDDTGQLEWCNQAFEELTGYDIAELLGSRPGQLQSGPKTDQGAYAKLYEAIANVEDTTIEVLNYRKSQNSYWVRLRISPILEDSSEPTKFMVLATDITSERNNAQRLLQQNENLKKIAFILSHELRKPVSSILGLLELYDNNNPDSPMNSDIVKYMHKATAELDEKIHDIIRQAALIDD